MDITTAYARLGDLHTDIPGVFQGRYRAIFEDDVFDSAQDEGGVCFLVV